jgi:Thiolase, C-terminal domain
MPEAVIVANACSPIGRAGTRIVSTNLSALSPEIMDLRPVDASRQALSRAGLTINDIDLVEINEAFAAQVIPSYQDLGGRHRPTQRARRRHCRRAPWHDRWSHHDDIDQWPCLSRQACPPRNHVRRRRAGNGDGPRASVSARLPTTPRACTCS